MAGSHVPGILQARTLEWVAISFSNAWKWKLKVKSLSRVRLLATPWTAAYWAPLSMGFSRQEYWSGVPLPSPRLNPKEPSLETMWLRVLKNSADTRWLQHLPCYWPVFKWQKHLCASYEECRVLSSCCCSFLTIIAILFSMKLCLSILIFITMEYITSKAFSLCSSFIFCYSESHILWPF